MRSATKNRTGKDALYLAWLHTLPCVICESLRLAMVEAGFHDAVSPQFGRTEAAHVGARGLSQKCPDREAIPLCRNHHREGAVSIHKLQRLFWGYWELDRDVLIETLNAKYEEELAA